MIVVCVRECELSDCECQCASELVESVCEQKCE